MEPAQGRRVRQTEAAAKGDTVGALDRGLGLLRCFTEQAPLLGYAELERLTGIPRPTVVRLVATLVGQGMLRPAPSGGGFMLGAGLVALARVFLVGLDVRAVARPLMQALANECQGTIYLAIREGLELVLIEACRAHSVLLSPRLDVGSRVPLTHSALGRAYLLACDDAQRAQLLDSLALARGDDWSRQGRDLSTALEAGRHQGYCLSIGEFHRDINSIAMPLRDAHGDVMAINFGGAAYDFPAERLERDIAPRLRDLIQQVAGEIGGTFEARPALTQEALV